MGSKFQNKTSLRKNMIIFLFLLGITSPVVRGFSLKSCYISKEVANCFKSALTLVPTDIPPTVKGIDLSGNKISKIQASNFTHFPVLTKLDLKQNSISQIGKGTFSHLISLRSLILNSNKLVSLEDDVFDGLSHLVELRIAYNNIKTVAPNAFKSLKGLTLLELSSNKLGSITQAPLILQHMPHLKELRISHNGIKTFQSQELTDKSIELKYLDLSQNPLEKFEITADVFPNLTWLNIGEPSMKLNMMWDVKNMTTLHKVTVLDVSSVQTVSNEKLRKLLSTFNSSLTSLRVNAMKCRPTVLINMSCSIPTVSSLQLERNKMSFIGSNLFQMCGNVTEIDLDKNKIKLIENGSFASLPQLRILSMSRNKLPSVPFAITDLKALYKLDLSFNLIKTLTCHDFANLTNLWQLSLQWNSISALNDCVFHNLMKLQVLELQGNAIAKLNYAFKTSLPNLKLLRLNHNMLTVIKKGEFSGLRSLLNLSLFENKIETLEKGCFSGLSNLLILQLQTNNIKKETIDKASFNDLVNLRSLDLGNNHIKYRSSSPLKQPPFLNLSRLETLAINVQRYTKKSHLPSNLLQGLTNLLNLNCKNMQLLSLPVDFLTYTPRLKSLDISANDLMDISPKIFAPIPNLTQLRLTSINLHSLDFLTEANLTKLQFFQARKNAFSVISKDIIKSLPALVFLDLKYNSFTCDCDNSRFVRWVENNNQTQVYDAHSFKCNYPRHYKGKKLLDLNIQSCLIDVGFICFISTSCGTVLMMVASFTYHFMRWQLSYAYYIFLAWLFDTKYKNKQASSQYDAFVSYNTHDEAWVIGELLPHLEEQQGWKLCLHHRDFQPGKAIVENITDAIYGSRKTICVISRRYLQSEWCSREIQVASFRLFDEHKDVLILVFLEDIPTSQLSPYYRMRKVLKRQTYLSWPRAGEHAQLFWEKLRLALSSTDNAAEDRLLLTVTDTQ